MSKSNDRIYRRKNKEGNPTGSWLGWYYTDDGTCHKVNLRTKDRATAIQRLRELERGTTQAAKKKAYMSLEQACQHFLDTGCLQKAEATRRMYFQKCVTLCEVLGPKKDIHKITLDDLEQYILTRRKTVQDGTIFKEFVGLRQVLKYGRKKGWFHGEIVFPEFRNKYEPRRTFLEPEDARILLENLDGWKKTWVMLALYAGCRRGEVERMEWQHIDFRRGRIRIPGTKTGKSKRTIKLSTTLARHLMTLKGPRDGRIVKHWSNVSRHLKGLCKRLGIPRVGPNDLRRTFGSWLVQGGAHHKTVADMMGHTTTMMIDRVYGVMTDNQYADAMDALDAHSRGKRKKGKKAA